MTTVTNVIRRLDTTAKSYLVMDQLGFTKGRELMAQEMQFQHCVYCVKGT